MRQHEKVIDARFGQQCLIRAGCRPKKRKRNVGGWIAWLMIGVAVASAVWALSR